MRLECVVDTVNGVGALAFFKEDQFPEGMPVNDAVANAVSFPQN